MDEFVKFNLMKAMEEFAGLGSVYLKQQLQPDRESLERAGDEIDTNYNWIDPDNEEDKDQRQKAANALRKLQDPEKPKQGLKAYLESLKSVKLGPEYAWVGWLHRDRKNQWTVTFKTAPATSRSAKLCVLTRGR